MTAPPAPAAADGAVRAPLAVVTALTALWVAVAAAAVTLLPAAPLPLVHPRLPAVVLGGLFAATQASVLTVQRRREARSVSLSEIPLLVGLLHLPVGQLLLARVLGAVVGLCLVRRQYRSPHKLVFNGALAAAECAVAVQVHARLVDSWSASSPHLLWASAAIATCVAAGFTAAGVGLVIHLLETGLHPVALLRLGATSALQAAPVAALGVVVAAAWSADPWAVVPLAACTAFLLLGYRAYAELDERHLGLERLYRFSQAVSAAPGIEDVLRSVLQQARELAQAERARITFLDDGGGLEVVLDGGRELRRGPATYLPEGDPHLAAVVERGEPVLLERGTRAPSARHWLAAHGVRDSVMVPLHGESGPVAVLAVDDRLGDVRGFGEQEVRLLQTVAAQAAVALRNGRLVEQLRHEALHDPLTGLPNRTMFARDLDARLGGADSAPVAVGILDLDSFKDVNDTLGHALGDELLREVARRMRAAVEPLGQVARLGGDEFAVLLPCPDSTCPDSTGTDSTSPDNSDTSRSDAAAAERWAVDLLHAFDAPVELAGIQIAVSASLGLALSSRGASATVLLKQADVAMYDAKHLGRGVSVYRPALDTASPSRLALVAQLRQAVERGEVEVHVQPKVHALSGRPVGSEALARWTHAERGAVGPDEFVPLAERSGLIGPLTELVLGRAASACAGWQDVAPGVGVSVNVSARSLSDDALVGVVDRTLAETGLAPALLTLEITESHIMADPAGTLEVLHRLRERGLRLSVDDFGTGYSSLSYLRRLPVSEVKVDRSFVLRMTEQAEDAAIVRSIIQLGGTLGLRVVAEGVEDERTWAALRLAGCDEVQGWVVAPAMPAEEMAGWLTAWRPPASVLLPPPARRHAGVTPVAAR